MNSEKSQNGEFKKVLGLGSLVVFGLAYMAPTVVFNYYGPLSVASNGMYPTCIAITAIAMFFTAFSYANMSREFQKSGSAYVYVQQSLNPHFGFATGWVMLLDYLLLPMICILAVALSTWRHTFRQFPHGRGSSYRWCCCSSSMRQVSAWQPRWTR